MARTGSLILSLGIRRQRDTSKESFLITDYIIVFFTYTNLIDKKTF